MIKISEPEVLKTRGQGITRGDAAADSEEAIPKSRTQTTSSTHDSRGTMKTRVSGCISAQLWNYATEIKSDKDLLNK